MSIKGEDTTKIGDENAFFGFLSLIDGEIRRVVEELENTKLFRPRYVELTSFMPLNDEEVDKLEEWEIDETITLKEQEIQIKEFQEQLGESLPIVAVDVSSIRIGETERGIIGAYRAALVICGEEFKVEKLGPYALHLTEENKLAIYNHFRKLLGLDKVGDDEVPRLSKLVDRIRNAIERMLQKAAAKTIRNGIILWDGSLIGGTVDTPMKVVKENIKAAYSNGNSVVGVYKRSWLKTTTGKRLINLLEGVYKPCYIDVHKIIATKQLSRYLGHVYVAKFSHHGFTFRVDVAPKPGLTPVQVLEQLVSNCQMYNGYPEPLRCAHIESYLTANEILALQTYIAQKYDLTVLKPFDIRKHILSPFG